MKIKLKLLNFETPNRNGRIMSEKVCKKAIEEYINSHKEHDDIMLGCLNSGYPEQQSPYVNLGEVSHRVDDLYIENEALMANCTLLDTPNGKLIKQIGLEHFAPQVVGNGEVLFGEFVNYKLYHIDLVEKEKCNWINTCLEKIEE